MTAPLRYCNDSFRYQRRVTREVKVGAVGIGGDNPIRVQSMTTSDTLNTEATVRETLELVAAGCEIVRITAPTVTDAENLRNIRDELRKRGCHVPLVADIHFLPKAAMTAVEYVEKIRVNPGNYADKKKFAIREYTDAQYHEELERIEESFTPLVLRCKELGRAMRIGTNHGSLSDRILNRYGDTPQGMVESALEFVRICRTNDYHNLVLSMKASNPKVMIQAYRLLAAQMNALGMDYPFHLGVTEAGDGEDGRTKSAVGIGALLEDGIGDTVRVSLTEDSIHEIPVCQELVRPYNTPPDLRRTLVQIPFDLPEKRDPFSYSRRPAHEAKMGGLALGGEQTIRVEIPVSLADKNLDDTIRALHSLPDTPAEILQLAVHTEKDIQMAAGLVARFPEARFALDLGPRGALLASAPSRGIGKWIFEPAEAWADDALRSLLTRAAADGVAVQINVGHGQLDRAKRFFELARELHSGNVIAGVGAVSSCSPLAAHRMLAAWLDHHGWNVPIQLREIGPFDSELDLLLGASRQFGGMLCDGIGDSIQLGDGAQPLAALRMAYNILQATGNRVTRTEYVSCPSCGRTLFNLQTVTERIKSKTSHLKGVKIAIMGCIVNGPGEMADADFGYVGGAPGKVNLYVGKECVQFHVPEAEADDRLMDLIKTHGKWQEPVPTA